MGLLAFVGRRGAAEFNSARRGRCYSLGFERHTRQLKIARSSIGVATFKIKGIASAGSTLIGDTKFVTNFGEADKLQLRRIENQHHTAAVDCLASGVEMNSNCSGVVGVGGLSSWHYRVSYLGGKNLGQTNG